ncbi:hypothetical protein ACG907_02685 [Acinetobacter bereziniae]|uniref:hypothetical protein n=1 Tax=Acinetobacter bereziniae TaxID=106648 RepID=UPI003AF59DC1
MNYSELEKKYEDFINHEKFPEIEEKANLILKNENIDDSLKKEGNWTYNLAFLTNFFETPKGGLIIQTSKRLSIVVDDKIIDLNTDEAPDFRNQDEYLKWLHTELNK